MSKRVIFSFIFLILISGLLVGCTSVIENRDNLSPIDTPLDEDFNDLENLNESLDDLDSLEEDLDVLDEL